mgnify:CR=1 FL=1
MRWRLAGCLYTVVAADTATGYGRVIHECDDRPVRGDVAVRTFTACGHMIGRLR